MFNINNVIGKLDVFAHRVLGDTVIIEQADGNKASILAMFEWRTEEDELVDRVIGSHPILEEILRKDAHLFDDWENVRVLYRDVEYSVLDFIPKNDRNYTAILRTSRVSV